MRKFVVMASLIATTLGAGVGGAIASSPTAPVRTSNSAALQAQASSLMKAATVAAAQWRAAHPQTAAQPDKNPPSCPPSSIGGRNGIPNPPCGVDHNNITPKCPPNSPNHGNPPPCGTPPPPPPAPPCGPSSQGGSPATGPITGPLYGLGQAINDNGGSPLGDVVQTVACAVFNLTGGAL